MSLTPLRTLMEGEVVRVPANPIVQLKLLSTLEVAVLVSSPQGCLGHVFRRVELELKVPSNTFYALKITYKNFVLRVGRGMLLRCGPIVDPLLFYS